MDAASGVVGERRVGTAAADAAAATAAYATEGSGDAPRAGASNGSSRDPALDPPRRWHFNGAVSVPHRPFFWTTHTAHRPLFGSTALAREEEFLPFFPPLQAPASDASPILSLIHI